MSYTSSQVDGHLATLPVQKATQFVLAAFRVPNFEPSENFYTCVPPIREARVIYLPRYSHSIPHLCRCGTSLIA